ncbi:MAG: hypothetical protein AUH81_13440 [Candidatus Rokubacteria bacterium 13_1_40CM_4_69_5]|nr:MAG: hypothetical protein AUH81_13440 [Candidatus Rokubacteria bacterium 13_1_40CM_4_69_5]
MACDSRNKLVYVLLVFFALALLGSALPVDAQDAAREPAYRAFPVLGSRLAVWAVAQLHLNFAAFILGCPIFAVIIEIIGWRTRDQRYDWLAHEFVKLTFAAFSTTAMLGALLLFLFVGYYPRFWAYLTSIFFPTYWVYALLFFGETFIVYLWYYGWEWLSGSRKWIHVSLGVLANLVGTAILVVANSWVTFMISPGGIDESGRLVSLWKAINNYTWMPINVHRLIANIVFGGTIAAAYAAFRFLSAETQEERARYDWMGYVGNFVAVSAFIVLPFAGYWLGREIYAFNQTMGITMMGGFMSWLWIVQAILIGILFLGSNYYLWLGMERIPGSERYRKFVPPMLLILTIGFMIWATPRTMVITFDEARAMGGTHHPVLGFFGVMSAKNTVVNLMILTTFLSYILYRRANRISTKPWVRTGMGVQWAAFAVAAVIVVFFGPHPHRILGVASPGRADLHRDRDGHRHPDVPGRPLHRHHPVGDHCHPLPVRAHPARGDLHVADGTDGLRPLGHPPALARLRRAARYVGGRGDAGAGLRRQRDHHRDDRVLRPGDLHLLAGRAR